MSENDLITRKQAAAILGLSEQTLRHWAVGDMPRGPQPIRIGSRSVRYRLADVRTYAASASDGDAAIRDICHRIEIFKQHATANQLLKLGGLLAAFR